MKTEPISREELDQLLHEANVTRLIAYALASRGLHQVATEQIHELQRRALERARTENT